MQNTPLFAVIAAILILGLYGLTRIMKLTPRRLMTLLGGTIVGLLAGALLSIPLGRLPDPFGSVLPIVVSLLLALIMIRIFQHQEEALAHALSGLHLPGGAAKAKAGPAQSSILVDTSVIIDGRIADIAQAGFVPGKLLVPRFVLAELQSIADSDDALRRGRGRRGLEMLNTIQGTPGIDLEIIEEDVPGTKEVDAKLVALGHKMGANILTTDYNLNRVAQIEGVRVLNINELANAIRPVVLPGEEMAVKIVQAGKERNQGVGYLPDGTMIVVENGDRMIGQEVPVEVTRVFQTVAGKMIFATPKSAPSAGNGNSRGRRGSLRRRQPRETADRPATGNSPQDIEDRLVQGNQNPPKS